MATLAHHTPAQHVLGGTRPDVTLCGSLPSYYHPHPPRTFPLDASESFLPPTEDHGDGDDDDHDGDHDGDYDDMGDPRPRKKQKTGAGDDLRSVADVDDTRRCSIIDVRNDIKDLLGSEVDGLIKRLEELQTGKGVIPLGLKPLIEKSRFAHQVAGHHYTDDAADFGGDKLQQESRFTDVVELIVHSHKFGSSGSVHEDGWNTAVHSEAIRQLPIALGASKVLKDLELSVGYSSLKAVKINPIELLSGITSGEVQNASIDYATYLKLSSTMEQKIQTLARLDKKWNPDTNHVTVSPTDYEMLRIHPMCMILETKNTTGDVREGKLQSYKWGRADIVKHKSMEDSARKERDEKKAEAKKEAEARKKAEAKENAEAKKDAEARKKAEAEENAEAKKDAEARKKAEAEERAEADRDSGLATPDNTALEDHQTSAAGDTDERGGPRYMRALAYAQGEKWDLMFLTLSDNGKWTLVEGIDIGGTRNLPDYYTLMKSLVLVHELTIPVMWKFYDGIKVD